MTIRFAAMPTGEWDAVDVDEAWGNAVGDPTTTGRLEVAKTGYEAEAVTFEDVATAADPADGEAADGQLT